MAESTDTKQIYIVISQTGTILSRILKGITGAEYNHASISLLPDLSRMYSFGRVNAYIPFIGGFVLESPHFGTFKRFSRTKAVVLAIPVSAEKHAAICAMLEKMLLEKKKYHYNYLGLFLAGIRVKRKRKNCYYCSEFVRDVLLKYNIRGADKLDPIVQPIQFLTLPATPVYRGMLKDYSPPR